MSRAEERRQARESVKGRSYPGWTRKPSPKSQKIGTGWFAEVDLVLVDDKQQYVVMVREETTNLGIIQHAAIRSAADMDIPWREKQWIKNEIFGPEAVAVEVFPKETELIDAANVYHLWVLPEALPLPFGLHLKK